MIKSCCHICENFIDKQMSSKIVKGAKLSAVLQGISETTKANGLTVKKYLVYLFEMFANSEVKERDMLEKCIA